VAAEVTVAAVVALTAQVEVREVRATTYQRLITPKELQDKDLLVVLLLLVLATLLVVVVELVELVETLRVLPLELVVLE
jgi:hypothetical protein